MSTYNGVPDGDNRPYELHHPSELERLRAELAQAKDEADKYRNDWLEQEKDKATLTSALEYAKSDLAASEQARKAAVEALEFISTVQTGDWKTFGELAIERAKQALAAQPKDEAPNPHAMSTLDWNTLSDAQKNVAVAEHVTGWMEPARGALNPIPDYLHDLNTLWPLTEKHARVSLCKAHQAEAAYVAVIGSWSDGHRAASDTPNEALMVALLRADGLAVNA